MFGETQISYNNSWIHKLYSSHLNVTSEKDKEWGNNS